MVHTASLRKEAKRDPAAFVPKMHQRVGLGAFFRGSCNCIILGMATEPAMGSAAFLNEAINQLAENCISHKEQETGEIISYENRFNELQKVKMYIADRNVYGFDLNPVAVELAEVSLWLNTIYEGGFVPWFGTQLVNGNSLLGARRQVYRIENAQATSKGMRWYEMEPERLPFGTERADKGYKFGRTQIYHYLLGDPGMCSYSNKIIKFLEIDDLWEAQIKLRKEVGAKTQDVLSIFGHMDDAIDSRTTIRQKDKIKSTANYIRASSRKILPIKMFMGKQLLFIKACIFSFLICCFRRFYYYLSSFSICF